MRKLFLLFVSYSVVGISWAQCAMCKAQAEQSLQGGKTTASMLNHAILFMMAIPVLLLLGIYFWYRKTR
ncbi:MAG: hypothetical protein MUE53_05510 [Chitinophagales bacterium]|jgi:hypothetical protein|nr:hypothetical protein [Chitinophagales bacterium]